VEGRFLLKAVKSVPTVNKHAPQKRPASNPEKKPFYPEVLDRTVIAIPLLRALKKNAAKRSDIIIDLNLDYPEGRAAAKDQVLNLLGKTVPNLRQNDPRARIDVQKKSRSSQYLFRTMEGRLIRKLVRLHVAKSDEKEESRCYSEQFRPEQFTRVYRLSLLHFCSGFSYAPPLLQLAST